MTMPHESPRKRRKTHHENLDEEDADALLRRFQRKPAPAPSARPPTSSSSSEAASSRPGTSGSAGSGSEEGELRGKDDGKNGDRTSEELGSSPLAGPKHAHSRTHSNISVPRFGEDTLKTLNSKRSASTKDEVAKSAASPRSRSPRDSSSERQRANAQENAGAANGGSNGVQVVPSPRNGSSRRSTPKEITTGPEKASSHSSGGDKRRSASRSRFQDPEPKNDDMDKRIAHQRREDLATVKSFWGDAAYGRYHDASPSTAESLAYLAKQLDEKTARYFILNETLLRMDTELPTSGHNMAYRGPAITAGDVRKAREQIKKESRRVKNANDLRPPQLDVELLRKFNLRVGAFGLLEPGFAPPQEFEVTEAPGLPSTSPNEPVRKKSASSPLAAPNSPAPLPKREESTHSSQSPHLPKEPGPRKSSFTLQSLGNRDAIDLTLDDSDASHAGNEPPRPKPKPKLPPASEIITIDSSNNTTRRTTPVFAEKSPARIANGTSDGNVKSGGKSDSNMKSDDKADSSSTHEPNPEPAITNSMRDPTPLPTYTLMPRKKKRTFSTAEGLTPSASSAKHAPTQMQPTDARTPVGQQPARRASGSGQTPLGNGLPNAANAPGLQLPVVQQPVFPYSNLQQPTLQQSSVKQSPGATWKVYRREEDCLMVYLKTVFRASQSVLAAALPGRTPGAINTRYSTKLKDGQIPLRSAIECLEKSPEFRRYLNPARHNPILAQLPAAPVAGPAQPLAPSGIAMANPLPSSSKAKPRHAPLANLSFKNLSATEDESSDHSHSAASGRERERRTRKAVNYNVKAYFSGTNLDQDNEPSDEVAPVVQAPPVHSGTEGIPILPKIPKSQRSYKYAKSYLARHERKFLRQGLDAGTWDGKELREWSGTSIHIGLSAQEIKGLQEVALGVLGLENPEYSDVRPSKRRMEAIMKNATEAEILEIAAVAAQRKSLPDRSKESVEAALRDAQDGCLDESTLTLDDFKLTTPTVGSMVRHRELGKQYIRTNMKTKVFDTMGPSISFTGTSNDLNTVAWAPNGVQFAAGSTCHVDYDSMQYNRPNNLLFGSMNDKSLQELPEHHTLREKPASGPNSQHSMHVTQDRRLFQTVASVCFSPDGRSMYSAGYDGMVRFWDVKESGARQRLKMWRNAKVDLLAVSKTGMLATAAQRTSSHTITVFDPEQSEDLERWSISSFTSRKAAECPENKIYPSTIRFDPYDGDYLLAGFASTSREDQLRGESCLWNVNTGTQLHLFPETRNVFDVAWNPTRVNAPTFAVGCVAGTNVNRGVRSVVKMYDPRSAERCMSAVELDCPALDMNDVMFCPFDDNYIVAGCTNGRTYVWDLRQTHKELCLYSLVHGNPLIELADPASRERLDTGIRFCSWGHDRRRFYTGSSDGVIKSWDLYRAPEDTFIRDVVQLNSGVMCGSFSPDYSSLLLGEVNGSINVLEVGNDDRSIRDADSFDLISAPSDVKKPKAAAGPEDADSGVVASRNLVETSQMTLAPMGGFPVRQALQGWNYAGPFDLAMDAEDLRDQAAAFQRKLASGIGDTCTIKGCNDFKKFTEEECVDSGRWKDRIPAALTLWREPEDSAKTGGRQKSSIGAVPQLKCSEPGCGRRALLRSEYSDLLGQELEFPSCELHHFGCLRCGERNNLRQTTLDAPGDCGQSKKDDAAARFIFWHCDIYRADVLGYKRIPDPRLDLLSGPRCNRRVGAGEEKLLSRRGRRLVYSNDPDAEAEEDDDDDDNGVDEHYAGLWGLRDAPPAPPFLPQTPPPPSSSSSSSSAPPSPSQARRAATATAVAVVIPSTSHGKPSSAPLLSSSSSPPPQGNGAQQSNGGGAVCGSGSRGSDALAVAANEGPKSVEQVVGDADLGRPLAGSPRMEAQRQAQLQSQRSRGPALSTETIEAVEARAEANARAHARATGRALSVEILAGVRAHARAQAVANSVHAGRTHLQQVTEREQEPQYFGVRVGVCGPDAMELDFDSTMPMPADTATRVDSDALDHINAPRNGDQAAQLVSGMASAAAPFANTNASSVSTSADALLSKSLKTTTTAAAATAATSPVQTVEVEGPSINNVNDMDDGNEDENGDEKAKKKQRRPSSAASSQQSASSGDSNKSRTPCVPM